MVSLSTATGAESAESALAPLRRRWIDLVADARPVVVLADGDDPRTVRAADWLAAYTPVRPCLITTYPVAVSGGVRAEQVEDLSTRHSALLEAVLGHRPESERLRARTDTLYLGAAAVRAGEAAGCIGGSTRPTADVLRAALRVLGTRTGVSTVSSTFLMVLPDGRTYCYADCAVVPEPSATQLVDIGAAAARTYAALTGGVPRVAMLSYSTRGSAGGDAVDRVRRATCLLRRAEPDLAVDGELQFDAAVVPGIGACKSPGSTVAGRANVLVFPDLGSGNIGYKITERLAGAIALGPLLHGLAAPMNDLSRGASAREIATVALLTAVQSVSHAEVPRSAAPLALGMLAGVGSDFSIPDPGGTMNTDVRPNARAAQEPGPVEVVNRMVSRARAAQAVAETYDQDRIDDVVAAVAWAIYEPGRARALAELSVRDTGLGRVEDKVNKNRRKTLGTLRDLTGARSVGVIEENEADGTTTWAKPVGVVAAVCPSTNPAATPANKTMMILKGRNAVVLSPSPKGASTCAMLVEAIHVELEKVGAPRDLVQFVAEPSKAVTYELMRRADMTVVTGSQKNVTAAYSSGRPAIGVGVGNAPVIVAEDADVADAAAKIARSKVFDYATSCSSENSVHVQSAVYAQTLAALVDQGGYLCTDADKELLRVAMWPNGTLASGVIGQPAGRIAALAGLPDPRARDAQFLMVIEDGVGPDYPFSGEKLSVVLTVYRYTDLDDALDRIQRMLDFAGAGHSCGIYTASDPRARHVAERLRVARIIVNQAHCFATGGSFDNGLGFTLTMGAGTWAGNSISENLSYRHFLNSTRMARVIPAREPSEDDLWGGYFVRYGR